MRSRLPCYGHRLRRLSSSKTYDTVIIGGGAIGSSIAYHLAKAAPNQRKILVIERDSTYRIASASLSAGGIRQQFSLPENVQMGMYGAKFLKEAEENLHVPGQDPPDLQFKENGYLFLAAANDGVEVLRANNNVQKDCGVDWMDVLDPVSISKKFPWLLTSDLQLGSFGTRNEGYFDPWSLVTNLKRKAISLGVEYMEGEVIGASMHQAGQDEVVVQYLRVASTIRGEKTSQPILHITSDKYVNAAGAWAGRLVDMLIAFSPNKIVSNGSSSGSTTTYIANLPIEARKRCIFQVHCPVPIAPAFLGSCPPPTSPLVIDPSGVYFRPEGGSGKFIVGVSPTDENDPPCNDDKALEIVDQHLFDDVIWPTLYERVPAFAELKVISSWAGFYSFPCMQLHFTLTALPFPS